MTLYETTVAGSTHSYAVGVGKFLLGIEVGSASAQTISVGTSAGGTQIAGPVDLSAGQVWVGQQLGMPSDASYTIHFSGLAGSNTIKIWLLG